MKKIINLSILCSVLTLLFFTYSYASEVEYVDPDGVRVQFTENGEMKSIISSAEAALVFGDRKDIIKAKKKAALRAKSEIAKFLNEKINSQETIADMTKTVTDQTSAGDLKASRKSIEVQTENISSSAEALLKGVVTLLEDINKDEKYVRIEVGMNLKTMRASDNLRNNLNRDLDTGRSQGPASSSTSGGRTVKKSRMYDDF